MARFLAFAITAVLFVLSSPRDLRAGGQVIDNHSFAILKDLAGDVFLYLKNDDCMGTYRLQVGKAVLGEGSLDVTHGPRVIPMGEDRVVIRCAGSQMVVVID